MQDVAGSHWASGKEKMWVAYGFAAAYVAVVVAVVHCCYAQ